MRVSDGGSEQATGTEEESTPPEPSRLLVRTLPESRWHPPKKSSFVDEDELEGLLYTSPDLLTSIVGEQAVVARQVSLPGAGPADLVAVTPSGGIAVIECKLRRNHEIRRWVIGQLLAYASALWRMEYDEFANLVQRTLPAPASLYQAVSRGAGPAALESLTEERFRRAVTATLASGRFRLILAVDSITDELKRIIKFLERDEHGPFLVALELVHAKEGGVEILYPNMWGNQLASGPPPRTRPVAKDAASFLGLWTAEQASTASAAASILEWIGSRGLESRFGGGERHGTLNILLQGPDGSGHRVLMLTTERGCGVYVLYQELRAIPPFDDAALRREFDERLSSAMGYPGRRGSPENVEERPNSVLYRYQDLDGPLVGLDVVDVLDWLVESSSQDAIEREQ
jgi:hypothetical protein